MTKELSDAEVFGGSSGELSDADVFGTPAAPATSARPQIPKPTGFVDSAVQGFKRALPETKSLLAGATAAAAGAVGADRVRDAALGYYRDVQANEVEPLANQATFIRGLKGESSLGQWAGDTLGNFGGQALQSLAAAGAGAALGSVVPGAGTAGGAVTGLVARPLVRKLVGKEVAKMAAEGAAKKEVGRAVLRRAGMVAAPAALNIGQETGIAYTGRADDAAAAGETLGQGDAFRAIAAGVPAGLLDTAAEGLVATRMLRGTGQSPSMVRRVLGGAAKGAATEGATEGAQAVLERAGAARQLTGADAYTDYVENVAAGALGGGVPGAASGVRSPRLMVDQVTGQTSAVPNPADGPISRAASTAADTGAVPTVDATAGVAAAAPPPELRSAIQAEAGDGTPRPRRPDMFERRLEEERRAKLARAAEAQVDVGTGEVLAPMGDDGRPAHTSRWLDDAGVPRNPSDEELGAFMHETLDAMGSPASVNRGKIFDAARAEDGALKPPQLNRVWNQVWEERKQALLQAEDSGKNTIAARAEPISAPAQEPTLGGLQDGQADALESGGLADAVPAGAGDVLSSAAGVPVAGAQAEELSPRGEPPSTDQESSNSAPLGSLADAITNNAATRSVASPEQVEIGDAPEHEANAPSGVSDVSAHAAPLHQPGGEVLQGVRGARNQGLSQVDGEGRVSEVSAGSRTAAQRDVAGPDRSERALRAGELPLGDRPAASGEQALLSDGGNAGRSNDDGSGGVEGAGGAARNNSNQAGSGTFAQRGAQSGPGEEAGQFQISDARSGDPSASAVGQKIEHQQSNPAGTAAPGNAIGPGAINAAAATAATSPNNDLKQPSEAQLKAGNYAKGHVLVGGLDVSIENEAGTSRRPEWPPLKHHYGYIKGSVGADKDHVDVFLTENAEDTTRPVFVVDQYDQGKFDEHKVVLGAATGEEARAAYLANYSRDFQQTGADGKVKRGAGAITQMSQDEFKAWVRDQKATKRPAGAPPQRARDTAAQAANAIVARIAGGAAIPEALAGADDATARAVAVQLGHRFSKTAPAAAIAKNLGARPQEDLRRAAKRSAEVASMGAKSQPDLRKAGQRAIEATRPPAAAEAGQDNTARERAPSRSVAAPSPKLDDFGEKLEGARKFLPPSLQEALTDEQIASQPLSKLWPADAHMGIENDVAAALAFAARAEVPAKPRKAPLVARWAEQVKLLRKLPENLENAGSMDALEEWAKRLGLRLDGFFARVRLLSQLPREQWGRVGKVGEHPYARRSRSDAELAALGLTRRQLDEAKPYLGYGLFRDGSDTPLSGEQRDEAMFVPDPHSSVQVDGKSHEIPGGKLDQEAVQQVRALLGDAPARKTTLSATDFEVFTYRNRPETFIRRKGDSENRHLKTFSGRDGAAQARAFLKDPTNLDALAAEWEKVKARDNVAKADTRRDANRARVGESRRNGKDVTEQMFADAFGFRGVQFGNWVGQGKGAKDRQGLLNESYDALLDLADILGIPSGAISLNGTLGLSLGARGGGKASAHFERDNLVINLTKTRGAGTLAHEWFHGLDNYFSRLRGNATSTAREANFITYKPEPAWVHQRYGAAGIRTSAALRTLLKNRGAWQDDKTLEQNAEDAGWRRDPEHKDGVRPEVERAFAVLVEALNASPMAARSATLDKGAAGYWNRIIERGARSFENYVIAKLAQRGWSNDFLANVRDWKQWADLGKNKERYPYLFPEEEAPIVQAFDSLFGTIQTRETEAGNVALFSRRGLTGADSNRKIALSPETLGRLRDRFGSIENWWRDTFGYGFEGFTESEAAYLLKLRGDPTPESIRDRVVAGGLPEVRGVHRSRAGEQGVVRGLAFDQAHALKQQLTSNWGRNAPRVVLVADSSELASAARGAGVNLSAADVDRVEGMYLGKPTVWLNLSEIRTAERFREVLTHEALGHFGVEQVIGKAEWRSIAETIDQHVRNGTGAQDLRDAIAQLRRTQPDIFGDPETVAKEVIAVMAEKGSRNGLVQRVVAAVRRFLRRIMPDQRWTDADIRGLLHEADRFLRAGRSNEQAQAAVRALAFSRNEKGVEFAHAEEALESRLAQWSAAVHLGGSGPRAVGASPEVIGAVSRNASGAAKQGDASREEIREQSAGLIQRAKDEGFFWGDDSPIFEALKALPPTKKLGGAEHQVYVVGEGENAVVIRATDNGFFGPRSDISPAQYLARLDDFNATFPSLQTRLIGVSESPDIDGHAVIWTAQPFVYGKKFGSQSALRDAMAVHGWKEDGYAGVPRYKHEATGTVIEDAHTDNVFHDDQGNLYPFDVVVEAMPAGADVFFSRAPAESIDAVETAIREINGEVDGGSTPLERVKQWLKDATPQQLKDRFRSTWLGALTTRHLTQLGSDYFPTMGIYSDYLAEMGADRNQLQQEGEEVAEGARKWAGKNRAEAATLFELMHDATILGVDPAEEYKPLQYRMSGKMHDVTPKNIREALKVLREVMRGRAGDDKRGMIEEAKGLRAMLKAEPKRKATYPRLVARWNQLSPEAQAHYRAMRDLYAKRHDQTEAALIQRINDLKMEGSEKRKAVLINMIRQQFEAQRLQGVYFPLQRFGRYFVAAERGESSTFLMFESQPELQRAVKGLRARGFKITAQGLKGEGKAKDAPSGTFVAEVIEKLRASGVSDRTQDEIYQMYLHALPELSMRKHKIHRKSVPGWDPDALRAFAFNMAHGAHQLARLRYAHKLSDTIDVLQGQQDAKRKDEGADTARIVAGDAILEELRKRHEWISNPQDSKLTNLVSSFGFVYYLGVTPAAALVNLTQTPLITYPYLAARFGGVKAMNALLAASRDAARTIGNIQRTLTDPEEQRAHQVLQQMGALDKTQAHNLMGIAEGGLSGHSPAWAKAMHWIGIGFHKTEVINREATGLAAFRLAREAGQSFDEAVKTAAETINETHYDYTNANRARFMQSGTAKVLLMFRQYSLNTTWHLGRMVWNATKGADPEVKRIARRNLTGILGMSALFSGALGLPLASVVMGVLNSIAASAGDDDEPWDAETEFRKFLVDMLGEGPARVVLGGVANEVTGADIAGRVSFSQLWFRDADRELDGRGTYYNLLEQAAGPMGGVLKNALVGKQLMDEGHLMRGVETVLPKALKDGLKSLRYTTEGVNNLRGDAIVPDLSVRQLLLQVGGFTPAEVADRYDRNRALKNYEQHVLDRRSRLVDAFALATRTGDGPGRADVMQQIRAFNMKWPEIRITPRTLKLSMRTRARYSAQAESGIVLNRKIAGRVRDAVGAVEAEG